MIDGETYRLAITAILLVGLAAGGAALLIYRPTRWRSPTSRDASGWVLTVTLLFAWSTLRVATGWITGTRPADQPLGTGLVNITLGLLLTGDLVRRLRRYMAALEAERAHPTRVCLACGGAGVVPAEDGA